MWVSRTHNNVLFMHENIETIMIEQIFYGCEQKNLCSELLIFS
jgi:hypothetical protein